MPTNIRDYFLAIAPIWTAYFKGQIGLAARDQALASYRVILPGLSASK